MFSPVWEATKINKFIIVISSDPPYSMISTNTYLLIPTLCAIISAKFLTCEEMLHTKLMAT